VRCAQDLTGSRYGPTDWTIKIFTVSYVHIMWVCHHGMECPRFEEGGEGLQMWRVAMNTLNK